MSKALTAESYEDELKPLVLKPQDSEFSRKIRISFNLETTEYGGEIPKEQIEFELDRLEAGLIDKLDYLLRDSKMAFVTGVFLSAVTSAYISKSISVMPSLTTLPLSAWYDMLKSRLEKKLLPISAGIAVKEEEITIDPKKLEPNLFYLFSYKDEKYVTRKTEKDTVEIYEVTE